MNFEKLIAALKCSSQAHTECDENCPYRTLEKTRDDFPIPADVVVDGVGYWLGCDCDRMANDAADVIATLSAERNEWIKFTEAMEKRVEDAQRQRDEMEDLMLKYQHDCQAAVKKTIDAEPVVHGHWVRENDWMPPKCSACELPPKTPGYIGNDDFYAANYKRCPNCGAKMDEEEEK